MKASILPFLIISINHKALAFLSVGANIQFIVSPLKKTSKRFSGGGGGKKPDRSRLPRKCSYRHTTTTIAAEYQGSGNPLERSTPPRNENWKDRPLPDLTVILPAFNEESRIGSTIEKYRSYLQTSSYWGGGKCRCDILVVDDGSTDKTCRVLDDLVIEGSPSSPTRNDDDVKVKYVSLVQNEGKGAAIARGIAEVEQRYNREKKDSNCQGRIILVADADGSGDLKSLDDMMGILSSAIMVQSLPKDGENSTRENYHYDNFPWHHPALVVGKRGYEGASASRVITRWGFRTTVKLFCGDLNVSDTQCGFKLMTITAGSYLYSHLNLKRWSHDVEVLFRAKKMGITVAETTVGWRDMEGSKLANTLGGTIKVSTIMLLEVLTMRLAYLFGRWKIPDS